MREAPVITPGAVLECTDCRCKDFLVYQYIKRCSKLIRVDGAGDLEVETPDPLAYSSALEIKCMECGEHYRVVESCGARASVESWHQAEAEKYMVYFFPAEAELKNDIDLDLWP